MLTIYGNDLSPPSNKVKMCANALGLEFAFVAVDLSKGEQKKPGHVAIHPAGKVPAIDDDGFTLFESDAIVQYLCRKHKAKDLYPEDVQVRAQVEQWGYYAAHHVSTAVGRLLFNRIFAPVRGLQPDKQSVEDGLKFLSQSLPVVDAQLTKSPYLAGNGFTLADIQMIAALDPIEAVGESVAAYKALSSWRQKVKSEAFYKKTHDSYEAIVNRVMKAA